MVIFMAIIGIDLGTTNSLGTVFRNGKAELIPNRFGSYLTPSVVSIGEDGIVLVGEIAKERLLTHPERTAASFKKDMGSERTYDLAGKNFSPEELSSFIIRSLLQDAKDYLGEEIEEAVISVPAYFHDSQRVATKRAGALAGITVNRIINEPSAAALASYIDTKEEQIFLIFDFGGGTLDVSLVECFDTMVEIISVSGDNCLGGDNFHEIMSEHFLKEHGLSRKQLSSKEQAVLLRQAESCKRRLSQEKEALMSAVIGGETYQSVYTNERLMEESVPILKKIKKVLTHALRDGELTPQDISAVVMAGGSAKMPLMQSYIEHLFHRSPIVITNCDEMIARGLGLICGVMERKGAVKDYVLTDICPFTLGIEIVNNADPERPYMAPIIERNTVLPCSKVRRFYTTCDNQTNINILILQGEHTYARDNLVIGKMNIAVPPRKKGEESVDVRFSYDINGILVADVTVISTGEQVSEIISQNVSESDLKRRMEELEKLKVHPKDLSENKLMMERLSAMYEEAPVYLRDPLQNMIQYFEYLLSRQNPRAIRKYRQYLEESLAKLQSYDPFQTAFSFEEYQEEDEFWTEEDDDRGGVSWTS